MTEQCGKRLSMEFRSAIRRSKDDDNDAYIFESGMQELFF